jgi:hypothetical protein
MRLCGERPVVQQGFFEAFRVERFACFSDQPIEWKGQSNDQFDTCQPRAFPAIAG